MVSTRFEGGHVHDAGGDDDEEKEKEDGDDEGRSFFSYTAAARPARAVVRGARRKALTH